MKRFGSPAFLTVLLLAAAFLVACGEGEGPAERTGDPPTPGFTDRSGRTDIPAFGVVAGKGARIEAQAAIAAYLPAVRAERWESACALLHRGARAQLATVRLQGRSLACTAALPRMIAVFSPGREPYLGQAPVSALRVEAGNGFALFHGANGTDYWVAMGVEGGSWKVLSIVPQTLG